MAAARNRKFPGGPDHGPLYRYHVEVFLRTPTVLIRPVPLYPRLAFAWTRCFDLSHKCPNSYYRLDVYQSLSGVDVYYLEEVGEERRYLSPCIFERTVSALDVTDAQFQGIHSFWTTQFSKALPHWKPREITELALWQWGRWAAERRKGLPFGLTLSVRPIDLAYDRFRWLIVDSWAKRHQS